MRYNEKSNDNSTCGIIEMSVRELCAIAFCGGDLDMRFPPRDLYRRAAEGREIHKALQKSRADRVGRTDCVGRADYVGGYYSEVVMQNTCRVDGISFLVSGRADGLFVGGDGAWVVEEIKSVSDVFRMARPREADMAQLICYGYFLSVSRGLSVVTLRLTYVGTDENADSEDKEECYSDTVMSAEQLKTAYMGIIFRVLFRARQFLYSNTELRRNAARAVFPYSSMRRGQEELIRELYRDVKAKKNVFAEAPTGIGKTISALYPAVRAYGEGRCDKIFYLTAKGSVRREAYSAVERLNEGGTAMRAVVISSREGACINDGAKLCGGNLSRFCNPSTCPYANGYYDRVEGAIRELLESGTRFSGQILREAAKKHCVCPYELSLDISELCEIIICDYNYVFSPSVYLRRYFADSIPGSDGHRYVFLVDEAHNLVDRAREMYSGAISLSDVMALQANFEAYEGEAKTYIFPDEDRDSTRSAALLNSRSFDGLIGCLMGMARYCDDNKSYDEEGILHGFALMKELSVELTSEAEIIGKRCELWQRGNAEHKLYGEVERFSSELKSFRIAGDHYDERFVTFIELVGDDVKVRYQCLDPSGIMKPILSRAESSIFFSATLTPADYFADLLGGGDDSIKVSCESPFPQDRLCLVAMDGISTRFEDRDRAARSVVSSIAATVSARSGNYIVYFPSYKYMEKVYTLFKKKYPNVNTVIQRKGMSYSEREEFIASFKPDSKKLMIGFCVLGGMFSEGVDLPGRALIGAIIVGVGLPGLSNERNIMRDYFDMTREGEGYAYAYTYPGMNNVLQAAGRVIRREDDKGIVVLLDDRYAEERYRALFPPHWRGIYAVGDPSSLCEVAKRFWERVDLEDSRRIINENPEIT